MNDKAYNFSEIHNFSDGDFLVEELRPRTGDSRFYWKAAIFGVAGIPVMALVPLPVASPERAFEFLHNSSKADLEKLIRKEVENIGREDRIVIAGQTMLDKINKTNIEA
jgi:hypothetical protein